MKGFLPDIKGRKRGTKWLSWKNGCASVHPLFLFFILAIQTFETPPWIKHRQKKSFWSEFPLLHILRTQNSEFVFRLTDSRIFCTANIFLRENFAQKGQIASCFWFHLSTVHLVFAFYSRASGVDTRVFFRKYLYVGDHICYRQLCSL